MKYKLLQKLPGMEVGTIIEGDKLGNIILPFGYTNISNIEEYHDFFEEVKEPKTIYDLKEGDRYWYLCSMNSVWKQNCMSGIKDDYKASIFLTEREAKRNKLLRELATRTDKWLPEKHENYIAIGFKGEASNSNWTGCPFEYADYHNGLVFRNEEEYNKYITPEAEDLLFKL